MCGQWLKHIVHIDNHTNTKRETNQSMQTLTGFLLDNCDTYIFSGWSDLHWRSILWSRRWRWWWSPSWIRSWQIKTSDAIPSSHQKPEQELNSTNSKSHVNQAECAKSRTRHRVSNWHQEEHWCSLDWHWGGGGRVAAFLCGLAVLECNLFCVTS